MWTSAIRKQGTFSSKLRSIDWNDSMQDEYGGWVAVGTEDRSLSSSWITTCSDEYPSSYSSSCSSTARGSGSFYKSSFNLRGHAGEVKLVQWSPQGDRLATYDSWGYIKVWKNRANVLALDFDCSLSMIVKDIKWSTCGCYIAICGEEGHMQLLSGINGAQIFALQVVTSPRYGSYAQFTCLSWNKSITSIVLGTERGEIIDIDPLHQGRFVSTVIVRENIPIRYISYYGPLRSTNDGTGTAVITQSLSLYLANGEVAIFQNLSSANCVCVHTRIINGLAQWNSTQTVLAVVGYSPLSMYLSARFLDTEGLMLHTIDQLLCVQPTIDNLLHSISWTLSDTSLFIAYNNTLYSVHTLPAVPSLKQLCREYIITNNIDYIQLLPAREISCLNSFSSSLITPLVNISQQSFMNLLNSLTFRLHCSIIAHGNTYTLLYEQMGTKRPLLTAHKRQGKLFSVNFNIRPLNANDELTTREECWAHSPSINSLQALNDSNSNSLTQTAPLMVPGQTSKDPVIANVIGNTLTKRYRFTTTAIEEEERCTVVRELGNLNVTTHYIKCEPRDLSVTLYDNHHEEKISLASKRPEWNQQFGIFELDFGGRINRDSVKNFQIDWKDEIVFQFGKSTYDDYCLDFQHPFSPVTAFCVALASLL